MPYVLLEFQLGTILNSSATSGVGSLDFPWDRDSEGPYYRRPRGFMGHFDIDRYPCYPQLNLTVWPCPYVPRTTPPTVKPSKQPTPLPIGKTVGSEQPEGITQSPITDQPTRAPATPTLTLTQNGTEIDHTKTNSQEEEINGNNDTVSATEPNNNRLKEKNISWKLSYRSRGCWLATLFLVVNLW